MPVLLAVASAIAFWFGTGLHPIWWITWIAPLPVLIAAARTRALLAFPLAAAAWFAGSCNMMGYYHGTLGIPLPVALAVLLAPAVAFGLAVLLWRFLALRGASLRAALAFAAAWICYEFAVARFSPHSTFGSLAYSQMDCLPVVQIASLTGLAGILFLLFLAPAALARPGKTVLPVAGVLLVAVLWGWWRLNSAPEAQQVSAALIALDGRRTFQDYSARIATLSAPLIVAPEKIDTAAGAVSAKGDVVIGVEADHRNRALVYSGGVLAAIYDKQHMLPQFESHLKPGSARVLLIRPSGTWGVAICKDLDFPQTGRDYARDGIGLLLVPAWDFVGDRWLHSRMAVMRGVESGFSIARSARDGLLTVSDDRGRILAERPSGSDPLLAKAPVRHTATVYARTGDWFAWLSLALVVLLPVGNWGQRSLTPNFTSGRRS